ncbi:hypothetical protein BESB_046480 [Besnoitia besnoiti]|uniref:BRCA2 OB1 domain-containing protein n=1 Tax=Besnoitia besnoiti TaxID=94643 RepID=A0A2A9MKE7_BESBE|nr:hypothetical protein BESB_046480 [Besnoitia besnoiti]PFH36456.1 hypothetical protein BESB_046480 [Besnoitia besnoiti]
MDGLQIFWAHEEGEEDSGEEDEEEGEDLETQLLTCASLRTDARQPPPLWLPPHEVREETTRRAAKPLSSAVELDGTLAASREALPRSGAAATSPYSSGPSVLPAEPRASSPLLASACSPFPRPLPLQSLSALRSLHFSSLPSHAASSPVSKYPATSVSPPSDPVPASTSAAADSRASFVDRQSRSVTPCSSATRADSTAALWRSKETDASAVPPGTACGLPSHLSSSWSTAAASSAPSAFPLSGSSSSSPSASPIRSLSCVTGVPSCSGSASSPASSAGSSSPLKTQTPSPCSQLFSLLDDLLEGGVLCEFNSPSPKKSPGLGGRLSSSFSSDASSATPSPVKALATPAVASPSRAPHAAAPWAASSGSSAASCSLAAAPVSSRPLTSPVSASRAAQTPSRGSQTRAAVSPSAAACCSPRAPLSAFDSAATPPMLSSPLASLSPSSLPRSSSVDAASRASAAASRQSDPPPPPPSVVAQAEKTGDLHAQACVDFELDDLDDVLSQPSACASVVSLHARAPGSSPHHATPRPSPASRADCLSSAAAQNIADESTTQKADPSDADAVAACRVGGGGWSGEGAQSPSLPPVARAAELAVDRKLFDSNPLGGNPSGSARSLCLPQASGHKNSEDIPRRFLAFFDDSLSFSLPAARVSPSAPLRNPLTACEPQTHGSVDAGEGDAPPVSAGFRFASGRSVAISEEARERAKRLLQFDSGLTGAAAAEGAVNGMQEARQPVDAGEGDAPPVSAGFRFASGRSVAISEEARERAKRLLQFDSGLTGAAAAEGAVNGMQEARQPVDAGEGDAPPVSAGFRFASGRSVAISEEARERAKRLLQFDSGLTGAAAAEGAVNGMQEARQPVDAGEGDAPPVSAGFRFASGRSVAISEEARERAKRLLQFDSGLTGAAAAEGAVNGMQEARQPVDAGEGDAPPVSAGFRFASGRSVAISEEARERAKRLLQFDSGLTGAAAAEGAVNGMQEARQPVDAGEGDAPPVSAGFRFASGRSVAISEEARERAKRLLQFDSGLTGAAAAEGAVNGMQEARQPVDAGEGDAPPVSAGFRFASGRSVAISEEARERAKRLLQFDSGLTGAAAAEGAVNGMQEARQPVDAGEGDALPVSAGFRFASGRSVAISEEARERAKRLLQFDSGLTGAAAAEGAVNGMQEARQPVDAGEGDAPPVSAGFRFASGRSVAISEEARERAKRLLQFDSGLTGAAAAEGAVNGMQEARQPVDAGEGDAPPVSAGFRFASGRSVAISEEARERAKRLLQFDSGLTGAAAAEGAVNGMQEARQPVDAGEGDAPPVSAGFRFASGRSVAISEEARERAKRLLQFDSGLTGAAAAEGAVNGMQEARQPVDAGEGDAPPVSAGFRFASGRSVAISEEARERAKRLLQFDSGLTGAAAAEGAVNGMQEARQPVDAGEGDAPPVSAGFRFASGRSVAISEEARERAKRLLQFDSGLTGAAAAEGAVNGMQEARQPVDAGEGDAPPVSAGFRFASGRSVAISEEARERAKRLLQFDSGLTGAAAAEGAVNGMQEARQPVDAGEGDAPPVSAGFRFASGRSVAISEEARERAKRLLQFDSGLTGAAAAEGAVNGMQEARQPVDAGEGDAPPVSAGFRFASGRSVAISEEARERAKRLLQFDSSEGGGVGGSGLDGGHAAGHAREFKWMGAGEVVSQIDDKLVDELACFFESPRPALSLGVGGAAAAGGDDAGAEVAGCSRRDAETREPASVDSPHNLSPPPAVSLTVPSVASCPSLPVAASSEACLGSSAELATSSDSPVACRGSPASSAPACNNESVSCSSSSASSSPPSYVSPSSSCLHAPPPRLLRRRGPASGLLVRVAEAGAGGGRSGASPRDRRQFKAPRRNAQRAAPGGKHVAQARQSGAEVEKAQGARPGDSAPKATPQHEQEDENGSLAGTANDICVSKGLEPASSLMAFSEGPRSSPSGLSSPAVPSSSSRSRLLCADSSFCENRLLLRWLWGQHARSITVVVPCALRALFASSSFVPLSALRSSLSGSRPPHSHTASLSSAPASPRSSLLPRKSSSGLRRGVADFAFFFIQQGGWLLCLPEALRRSVDPLRCASLDASRAFVVFSCEAPAHAAGATGDVPAADSSKARGDGDEEEGLLRVAGADECYCMVQTYLQASREAKRQGSSLPSLLSAALARAAPSSLLASLSLLPNCGAGDARAASSDSKAQQRRGLSQTESGRFTRAWVRHHYALLSLYASQRWLQRCARAMADSRSDPEGVARQASRPASPSSVFAPGSPPPRPPSPLSLLRALLRRVDEEANGRSSILRQVCEGDLSPATPMILEVLQVSFPGSSVSSCRAPLPPSSAPDENLALLVSDGRYVIRAKVADSFLAFYLARVFRGRGRDARGLFAAHAGDRNGRATREFPRLKFHRIFVQGASLAGLSEPCCPLELPASACLVLHASTCRPLFSPARRYFPFLSLACVTSSPSVLCPPWLMSREPLFRGVSASAPALLSAASAASSSASLLLNSPFSLSPAASAGLLLRAAYPLGRWRGGRGEEGEARGGHGEQEARPKRRHAEEEERGVPHALKALRRGMTGEVSVADVVILRKGPLLYRVWRDRRQESCSAPARPEASGKRRGTEEKDAEDAADGSESSGGREVVVMTESEFSAWKQRQEDVLGRRRQEEWECLRERIDALRMKLDERRQRKKARSEVCAARRREEQAGLVGGVANGIQPVREGSSHSVACAAAPVSRMISMESERSTQAEEPEDDAKDEDEEELRDLERQERRLADAWSADRQGVLNQGKAQIEFLVLDTLFLLKLSALALQSSFSARGSPSLDSSPAAPGSSAPSPPSSVLSLSAHGAQGPAVSASAASVEKRPLSSPFDAASLVPAAVSSYLSPESASSRPQSSSPFGSSSSAAFSAFDGSAAASASFSPCIPVDSSAPAFFVSQRDIESALESAVEAEDATKQDVQVAAGGAAAGRSAAPLEAGGQADFEASRDSADAPLPLLGPLPQRAPAGEGAGSPAAARCVFPASGAAAAEPLAQLFLQSLAVLTLYAGGAEDEQETALRDLEEGERVKLSNLSCASGAQARGGLQSARSPGDLVAAAEDEEKRWRATWLGNARFRLLRMYGTNRVAPGSSRPLPFALPLSMLANACREELHLLQLSRASSAFSASNSLAASPMQASGCSPLRAATPHSLPPPSVRGCSPVSSHASLLESRKQASAEDEDIEEENGKPEKSEATEDAGNRSQRGRHGASRTGVASPQVVKNEGEEERRRRQPVRQTRGRKSAVSQSSSGDASLKDNARKRCREEGGRDTEEMIQGLAAASTEEKREEGRAKEQEDEGKGAKELMKTAAGSARDCIEEEGCLNKVGSRPSFGKAGDATTALKTPKENNAKRALSSLARRCLAWTPAPVCLGLFRLPLFSQAHRLALLLNSEQSAFESRERGDEALARQAKSVREAGRQRQLDACEGQDSSAARRGERQEQSGGVHSAANEPLERGDGMPAEGEAASWRAWVAVGGRCIPPLEPSGVVPGMMYDLVGVLILLEAHQPPSMPASASLLASGGSRGSALLSGVVAFLWTSAGCLCRARIRPARGAWRNAPAHRLTASAPALEEAGEDEGIREGGGEGCSVLLRYRQILLGADLCRRREAGGVRAGRRHGDATGLPGAHTEEDGLRRWWLVQAGDSEDEREATPASDERSPSGRLSSSGAPSSGPPGSGAAAARARAPSVSDSLRWAVFQNVEFESHDAALGIFNFSASARLLHVASGPISLPFLSRAPFSSSSPAHRSAWKASLRTAEVRGQRRAGESGAQADVGGPTAKKPERRPRQNAEASARKQAENDASKGAGEASEDAENEQASSLSGATKREESARRPGTQSCGNRSRHLQKNATCATEAPRENAEKGTEDAAERPGDGGDGKKRCLELSEGITTKQHPSLARARLDRDSLPLWWKDGACFSDKRFAEKTKSFEFIRDEIRELLCTFGDSRLNQPGEGGYEEAPKKRKLAEARDREETEVCGETEGQRNSLSGAQAAFRALQSARARVAVAVGAGKQAFFVSEF